MKVTIVSPGFPPDWGGVESVVGSIARHLAVQGEQVVVLAHGRDRAQEMTPEGVKVKRYPALLERFAFSPGLALAMRREESTIWHVHNVHSSLPFLVWANRRNPYVLNPHFHGDGHTTAARNMHVVYGPIPSGKLSKAPPP